MQHRKQIKALVEYYQGERAKLIRKQRRRTNESSASVSDQLVKAGNETQQSTILQVGPLNNLGSQRLLRTKVMYIRTLSFKALSAAL